MRRREKIPYTRGRRWPRLALLAVIAGGMLLGGLTLLGVVRGRGTPNIVERDPPAAYRVVYRVDEAGDPRRTSIQIVLVRRPYDGRNESTNQDGSDTRALVTTIDRAWRIDGEDATSLGPKGPSTPAGDARPLLAMGPAIREGLARRVGNGTVLGRACTKYAVAEPPGRPLLAPGPITTTELCIDTRGLILEERWLRGRKLARLKRAIELDVSPELPSSIFLQDAPPDDVTGEVAVTRIESGAGLRTHRLTKPPSGFRLDASYIVERVGNEPSSAVVDAWVNGTQLLIVEQITAAKRPWTESLKPVEVDLGRLGRAQITLDLVASRLHLQVGDDRWIRISGSVSPATLSRAARGLKRI